MSFAKFEKEFNKAVEGIEKHLQRAMRLAIRDTLTGIISDTPIGDVSTWSNYTPRGDYRPGMLRGNWQTTIDSIPQSELIRRQVVPDGGKATVEAKRVSKKFKLDSTLYFVNNRPYAQRVEDGWSKQAPSGMVKINMSTFDSKIQKYLKGKI